METPLFTEKQYFRQWWVWILILGLNGITVFGAISQVVFGHTFGDKPMSNLGIVIFTIVFAAFMVFFLSQNLSTKIDERGVYIKFFPYHRRWRLYTWEQIESCELKQYKPLSEYGGWGLRQGAYSMSGNEGLLLRFKSGKPSLMIGTRNTEEVRSVLEKLNKL
jgi:hypothetical protein